jgi:phosphate transport system substrate-binding protein
MNRRTFVIVNVALAAIVTGAFADTLINAGGATFPNPIYTKWFDEYHKKTNVPINYASKGSGFGIQQVTAGTIDFGASDKPMSDMEMKDFQDKRGRAILHFPTVLGGVVPTFNVPGVTAQLNFTGKALAGIYLGTITKWNDPEIANANKDVKLPANDIIPVHRADGSGTSFIFTDYLSKVSPDWKTKVGAANSPTWPPVGLAGQGTEGVAGQVKQTANTIGYVELIYALQNKMSFGKVQNAAGEFVLASLASVTAAAGIKDMPDDFRVSITNPPGKGVYPISSFTWLLIPAKIDDPAKKKAITDFLTWMLKDGQTMTEALSYAQLPKAVITKEQKAISNIK